MRSLAITLLLSTALPLFAQQPGREPYPSDYTPHPCAPSNSCISFPRSDMTGAAFRFLGLKLDGVWMETHADEVTKLFESGCRKQATCMATPGSTYMFCDDILSRELRDVC